MRSRQGGHFRCVDIGQRFLACLLILAPLSWGFCQSFFIDLTASPPSIPADGVSTCEIIARVTDRAGNPVPDGTLVRFSATAGRITPEASTQGGVARAILTSDRVAQFVTVTASVGDSRADIEVEFTAEGMGGRAARLIRVRGDYLAYSLDRRILIGTGNVRLRHRSITIEAQSLQLDVELEVVRAQGRIKVSSPKAEMEGDRLYLELRTLHGIMLKVRGGVEKRFFGGEDLKVYSHDQPIPPHAFAPVETEGTRTWIVAKAVTIYPRERIQFVHASIYVNETRIISLPYYIIDLRFVTGFGQQQLSVNTTDGLVLDFPFYIHADLTSTTAIRLRRAGTVGKGAIYARRRGWGIDLERQYVSLDGRREGVISLQDLHKGRKRLTFVWQHQEEFDPSTRGFLHFSSPRLRGFYASADLYRMRPGGDITLRAFANRAPGLPLSYTIQLGMRRRAITKGPLSRSFFGSVQWSKFGPQKGEGELTLGVDLYPRFYVGGRGGWAVSPWLRLSQALSTRKERRTNLRLNVNISRHLGRAGQASLSFSYDWQKSKRFGTYMRQTLGLNLYLGGGRRWFGSLYLTYGLRDSSLYGYSVLSYRFAPRWRVEIQAYLHRYLGGSLKEVETRLAYSIGAQEILLGWSSRTKKFWVEAAAAAF
ncbi:MAG TPA: hypothetical protein EYP65_07235 [Armatimonadetes bacterium]|nr:hypothetical protein [Armatimonadota bacterium]